MAKLWSFLLACKEMATRVKKLLIYNWMVLIYFKFCRLVLPMVPFQWELLVSNNILAFFCRLIRFYFITVYTEVSMHIKATIVAYTGLRVNEL